MHRRDVITLGALAAIGAVFAPPAEGASGPIPADTVTAKILRVYADAEGESRFESLSVSEKAGPIPLTEMLVREYKPSKNDWHTAPARWFAINMRGELEVETSDGERRRVGPGDLVFMEDTTGKGHVTRLLSPVSCLFIAVADGFDIAAWARGETAAP